MKINKKNLQGSLKIKYENGTWGEMGFDNTDEVLKTFKDFLNGVFDSKYENTESVKLVIGTKDNFDDKGWPL